MRFLLNALIALVLTQGYAIQCYPEPDLQAPFEDVF